MFVFAYKSSQIFKFDLVLEGYMRRYKYKAQKLFHIAVWSVIILLAINVILKSIEVFGPNKAVTTINTNNESVHNDQIIDFDQSNNNMTYKDKSNKDKTKVINIDKTETTFIGTIINYITRSNMPILKYATKDEVRSNLIFNHLVGMFPINEYAMEYVDTKQEHFIEDLDGTLYFTKSIKNRLNNRYYASMIILDLQNEVNGNVDHLLESIRNPRRFIENGGFGAFALSSNTLTGLIPIDIINGEVFMEYDYHNNSSDDGDAIETLGSINGEKFTLEQLKNRPFLYNNFYIVDSATSLDDELFDAEYFLKKDLKIKSSNDKPQILVYHTHSQEAYADSRKGEVEDTIVGVGSYLTKLLEEKYGFNVIHDTSQYDMMEGYLERNLAYNHANDGVTKILEENPSIEVIVDVHRDGNDNGVKRMSKINGKDSAQIMLFNGLSRNSKGKIEYLKNPYLKDNLAFSLQLQLKGRELFPGLMFKNYLHAYRYNLHFREKSLLAEVGTNWNTVDEAMTSMEYLAALLNEVLVGE